MLNKVSIRTSHLVLLLITGVWTVLLWKGGQYGGFNHSDFTFHERLVYRILDAFKHGTLGLDSWEDGAALGNSAFRTYQNFGHYLAAGLTWAADFQSPSRSLHLLTMFALILQGPAAYRSARLLGFSREIALLAAWFTPLISSTVHMSHQFESYLLGGLGLYTQALAFGPFLLALAWSARVTGWVEGVNADRLPEIVPVGFWIGLSFLLHHFYGYMALLTFGLLALTSLAFRWKRPGNLFRTGVTTAILLALFTGYQLLSVFQDSPLVLVGSAFEPKDRWNGLGFGRVMEMLLDGGIFDLGRFPALTLLAYLGVFTALGLRASRNQRACVLFLGAGIVLLSGREVFGSALDWLPGFSRIMLLRTVSLIHVGLVLLAAIGADFFLTVIRGDGEWRARIAARFLSFLVLTALAGFPFFERATRLQTKDVEIAAQEKVNGTLDPRIFGSVQKELREGNLWLPALDFTAHEFRLVKGTPRLGKIGYFAVASFFDLPQISQVPHHMSYQSEAVHLFKYKREYHYRLFNVQAVILPNDSVPPPFLKKAYSTKDLSVFRAPAAGMFDVVGVSDVSLVPKGQTYLDAIIPWVLGNESAIGNYAAIIPLTVAKRWPEAVPKASLKKGPIWGRVRTWERVESGDYKAVLTKSDSGALGMLRTGYHPRWKIEVNGVRRVPQWVGPGFLGFDLELGENSVVIEFPADPVRSFLFIVSLCSLLGCAMFLLSADDAYRWILRRAARCVGMMRSTKLAVE